MNFFTFRKLSIFRIRLKKVWKFQAIKLLSKFTAAQQAVKASICACRTALNMASQMIADLSESVGAPEAALRLLLSLLFGYPIAVFYNVLLARLAWKELHHFFFTAAGCALYYFNYGMNIYHSALAVLITFVSMRIFAKMPKALIAINFTYHMTYLLLGYYYTESADYDILWTMPHCILVLRMIGCSFDVADGQKHSSLLSRQQLKHVLNQPPTLLQLAAYAYFPMTFLVGPQFPYRRYESFINGEFRRYTGNIKTGLLRFLLGIFCLIALQLGAFYLPDDYLLSESFEQKNFIVRLSIFVVWAKCSICKYLSCWLLAEGALMLIGFTYDGTNTDGTANWYGCSNVNMLKMETGYNMQHYVQSFNVLTNSWVSEYVYKRLKFINQRTISYICALLFLSVWHGFHSGYYMFFLGEFMIVTTEKFVSEFYEQEILAEYGHILHSSLVYKLVNEIIFKIYHLTYMGWCIIPFMFLHFDRWLKVYAVVNYFGFIIIGFCFTFIFLFKLLKRCFKNKAN